MDVFKVSNKDTRRRSLHFFIVNFEQLLLIILGSLWFPVYYIPHAFKHFLPSSNPSAEPHHKKQKER